MFCLVVEFISQMTSKCGKKKKMAHKPLDKCVTDVVTSATF